MVRGLTLDHLEHPLAVCRLPADAPIPDWAWRAQRFLTISRTPEELSLTLDADVVPSDVPTRRGFCSFRVRGTIGFGLVGLLASLVQPLAEAGIAVYSISTHDTDYLLVKADDAPRARAVLESAGHHIV